MCPSLSVEKAPTEWFLSLLVLLLLLGAGVASKGGTVSSYSDEQQLDVHYHCLRQGEAMITITIPVGVYADVVFAWKKVCKKEFVTGLSVGLMPQCDGAPCEDVVSDGHAQVTATKTRHFFLRGYSDLFLLFRWHSSFLSLLVGVRWYLHATRQVSCSVLTPLFGLGRCCLTRRPLPRERGW